MSSSSQSDDEVLNNQLPRPHRDLKDDLIEYAIARTRASHKVCVVCNRKPKLQQRLKRVSKKAILNAYLHTNILIPFECHCCNNHFDELGLIKEEVLSTLRVFSQSIRLKRNEITYLVEILRLAALRNTLKSKFTELLTIPSDEFCSRITGQNNIIFIPLLKESIIEF